MLRRNIDDEVARQSDNPKVKTWLAHLDCDPNLVSQSDIPPAFSPVYAECKETSTAALPAAQRRKPLQDRLANSVPPQKDGDKSTARRPSRERNQKVPARFSSRASTRTNTAALMENDDAVSYGQSLASSGAWVPPPTLGSNRSKSTASRSSSPTKTMADLDLAEPPIRFVEAGGKGDDPPDGVLLLHKQFLDLANGFGAMPGALKNLIKSMLKDIESIHDVYFDTTSSAATDNQLRQWETVQEIRENARACNEDGDAQPGWSDMVYSRLLQAALKSSAYQDLVGFKNITVASIEPKSLLPIHLSGKPFGSKMVDYALILLPQDSMREGIRRVLQSLDDENCNINQTRYTPVRFNPITVNIEVKPPGSGKNRAMVQLAIWVAAQFNKLNSLCEELATIALPLVWVEGHDWRVFIAFQKISGELVIRGGPPLGCTGSIAGIYQIIQGIHLLAKWSETVYRPWFESNVLHLRYESDG